MKKLIVFILIGCLFSCASSKAVRTTEKTLKGNWTLSGITYSKTGAYDVTLLDDVSKVCFESSIWQFVPNNHTGSYNINNSSCEAGYRYFNFKIEEVGGGFDFLLKPTNEKGKSETNQGFRFNVKYITETEMRWQQTVYADGVPFIINMNFVKL